MYYVDDRTSSCIDVIAVNPLTAVAVVRYDNGREYTYKNVSRSSILNLMFNKSVSLGFFANRLKVLSKNNLNKTYCLGLTGLNFTDNLVTIAC